MKGSARQEWARGRLPRGGELGHTKQSRCSILLSPLVTQACRKTVGSTLVALRCGLCGRVLMPQYSDGHFHSCPHPPSQVLCSSVWFRDQLLGAPACFPPFPAGRRACSPSASVRVAIFIFPWTVLPWDTACRLPWLLGNQQRPVSSLLRMRPQPTSHCLSQLVCRRELATCAVPPTPAFALCQRPFSPDPRTPFCKLSSRVW